MKCRFLDRTLLLSAVCLCTVLAGATAAGAAAAGSGAAAPGGAQTWTVALYVNADNDLGYTWPRFTLPSLPRIPVSQQISVVALVDKEAKSGSFLYQIRESKVSTAGRFERERDFGRGATFRWFLGQVHSRFPSDGLIVVGWDHGYGWRYFSHDFDADDSITLPELRAALAGAGIPIDVLAFDACNMGDVEVALDVASVDDPASPGGPLVDYFVASEETIDQDGYPYGAMFAPLAADPARPPEQVTGDMLRGWDGYYGSLRCFDWVSLSAVDLKAVRDAGPAMGDLAARLRAGLAADPEKYGEAMNNAVDTSLAAWGSWQQALGMLAGRLVDGHELDDDSGLVAAAAAVRDAVEGSMVLGVSNGSYVRWLRGLSVWIGTGDEWAEYRSDYRAQSRFGKARSKGGVDWYRLLRDYNAGGHADPKMPEPSPGRATYGVTDVCFTDAVHGWAAGCGRRRDPRTVARTWPTRWRARHRAVSGWRGARAGTGPSSRAARTRAPHGGTPPSRRSSTFSASRRSRAVSASPPGPAARSSVPATAVPRGRRRPAMWSGL